MNIRRNWWGWTKKFRMVLGERWRSAWIVLHSERWRSARIVLHSEWRNGARERCNTCDPDTPWSEDRIPCGYWGMSPWRCPEHSNAQPDDFEEGGYWWPGMPAAAVWKDGHRAAL